MTEHTAIFEGLNALYGQLDFIHHLLAGHRHFYVGDRHGEPLTFERELNEVAWERYREFKHRMRQEAGPMPYDFMQNLLIRLVEAQHGIFTLFLSAGGRKEDWVSPSGKARVLAPKGQQDAVAGLQLCLSDYQMKMESLFAPLFPVMEHVFNHESDDYSATLHTAVAKLNGAWQAHEALMGRLMAPMPVRAEEGYPEDKGVDPDQRMDIGDPHLSVWTAALDGWGDAAWFDDEDDPSPPRAPRR